VREAVFNALSSLEAVDGAMVLDLFAGTGALGIEALSRGAAQATFVERDARARAIVQANLDRTGLAASGSVRGGTAEQFLAKAPRFDLALLDPPYAFADWGGLLAVVPAPFVVAESNREVAPPPGWGSVRARRYGTTVTTFLELVTDEPEPGPPEGNE